MKPVIWQQHGSSWMARVGKHHKLIALYQGHNVWSLELFAPEEGIWTVGIANSPERAIELSKNLQTVKQIKAYLDERKRMRKVRR